MKAAFFAPLAALTAIASAQTALHGVLGNGDVIRIDPATGAAALIGNRGATVTTGTSLVQYYGSAIGTSWSETLPFAVSESGTQATFALVSPCNGGAIYSQTWTIQPAGTHIRAAAYNGTSVYLVQDTPSGQVLALLDAPLGGPSVSSIGPTDRTDLVAVATNAAAQLYALGTDNGGELCTLNPLTGAATLIGPCAFGDARSLTFLPDGILLACGANLLRINPATGAVTVIGATGFSDVRALAATPGCIPPQTSCYANCDGSWNPPPFLNVQDYGCFLYRFAVGDPYANCDGSTTSPMLNIQDFACFLNRFASGCP